MRREEIVVVGGGLSGVVAAFTARRAGARVTLIDEQGHIGGYMRWTLSGQHGLMDLYDGKRGFELAQLGWELLYDAGVNVQLNSTAWGLFEDNVLGVVNPESSYQLGADRIILATGSTDIAIPFEGWELAGVMTARAALIAMNLHRVLPGRRVGIVGNGSDAEELVASLDAARATVALHVADAGSARAGGNGRVQWLSDGTEQSEVDVVVTANGVQPDPELALQALAESRYSEMSGVHVPVRDHTLMTTLPGVYIVGDAAGVTTTAEAAAEGMVAGEASVDGSGLDDAIEALARVRSGRKAQDVQRLLPEGQTASNQEGT